MTPCQHTGCNYPEGDCNGACRCTHDCNEGRTCPARKAERERVLSAASEACRSFGKAGAVLVCLINYCGLRDIDPVECLALAHDEIKDRKGYMTEDGTFVKEASQPATN